MLHETVLNPRSRDRREPEKAPPGGDLDKFLDFRPILAPSGLSSKLGDQANTDRGLKGRGSCVTQNYPFGVTEAPGRVLGMRSGRKNSGWGLHLFRFTKLLANFHHFMSNLDGFIHSPRITVEDSEIL